MTTLSLSLLDLAGLGDSALRALAASGFGPFEVRSGTLGDAVFEQAAEAGCDAVLLAVDLSTRPGAESALPDVATLIVTADRRPEAAVSWLHRGAQDILSPDELSADDLPRRIRAAIERKRLERESRKAYATDLDTGLPHQQQLIEHMSQLLALREREPSPMAVLVLRVEGLATAQARFGRESANVLRRKVAVRLRAGVRASDVVASLGDDSFGVLLGAMLAPADAQRVGTKLLAALLQPFNVTGNDVALAAALGVAQYPEDGATPAGLLHRAVGLAASTPAQGRLGFANFEDAGGHPTAAANDE